jgi:hypothetical protein
MIVYSNSCSYGVISNGSTYGKFFAEELNAKFINAGVSGCCNERILRTSTRDILDLSKSDNVLVLIGLTNKWRGEYWDSDQRTKDSYSDDGHFISFHRTTKNPYTDAFFREYDHEAATIKLLYNLIVYTSFLRERKVQYLIWSNSPHNHPMDWTLPAVKSFYDQIVADPNILSLFDFSFIGLAEKLGFPALDSQDYNSGGHAIWQAHKEFAKYLLEQYNKLY